MPMKTKVIKSRKTETLKKNKKPSPVKKSPIKKASPKSKVPAIKKPPVAEVTPAIKKQVSSEKTLSAETLKKAISFFYLLAYCPPGMLGNFIRSTTPMRQKLAADSGMTAGAFFTSMVPEVCRRIVAFHQATREPDPETVQALLATARKADANPESVAAFQNQMAEVSAMPGRAKPENRLHRNKGCMLCAAPCQYGYFTLVSDPQFGRLLVMLSAETAKPASEQSPLGVIYGFTLRHLAELTGGSEIIMAAEHLANLSFCLLMLGMAKSRLALPEEELRRFQAANQAFIKNAQVG